MALVSALLAASPAGAQELAAAGPGATAPTVGKAAPSAATWLVAARDLERGETLTAEDFTRVPVPADAGAGAGDDAPQELIGWKTRRVIAEGEPLRAPAVAPPDLVNAGEPVEAVFRGRTVVLRVKGTAAGSGAMGERVLVRIDARRRLEGVVIGPALVELES
jgi:flagella basal body P-ring formation protein FlgA